jgi:hypothetical protein
MDHSASKHAIAAQWGRDTVTGPASVRADVPKPDWLRRAEERLRGYRSLWETLTEEDWEFLRSYDGPEVLGPPPPPPMKRRPRRRGET